MRLDFPKESNVLVQKQKCGISNDVFSCESGTVELQYIVRNCGTSSYRMFCVRKQKCWTSSHRIFFVRRRNLAGLKVKALVWKRSCETSSRTKFIIWKRNCVTSKPQFIPCADSDVTKWIKSCLLPCFGTFKMPILMFISILYFVPRVKFRTL